MVVAYAHRIQAEAVLLAMNPPVQRLQSPHVAVGPLRLPGHASRVTESLSSYRVTLSQTIHTNRLQAVDTRRVSRYPVGAFGAFVQGKLRVTWGRKATDP